MKAEVCGKMKSEKMMKKKKTSLYAAEQVKVKTWTGEVSLSLVLKVHSLSREARFSSVSPVCVEFEVPGHGFMATSVITWL